MRPSSRGDGRVSFGGSSPRSFSRRPVSAPSRLAALFPPPSSSPAVRRDPAGYPPVHRVMQPPRHDAQDTAFRPPNSPAERWTRIDTYRDILSIPVAVHGGGADSLSTNCARSRRGTYVTRFCENSCPHRVIIMPSSERRVPLMYFSDRAEVFRRVAGGDCPSVARSYHGQRPSCHLDDACLTRHVRRGRMGRVGSVRFPLGRTASGPHRGGARSRDHLLFARRIRSAKVLPSPGIRGSAGGISEPGPYDGRRATGGSSCPTSAATTTNSRSPAACSGGTCGEQTRKERSSLKAANGCPRTASFGGWRGPRAIADWRRSDVAEPE